jgi:hypothetical protein
LFSLVGSASLASPKPISNSLTGRSGLTGKLQESFLSCLNHYFSLFILYRSRGFLGGFLVGGVMVHIRCCLTKGVGDRVPAQGLNGVTRNHRRFMGEDFLSLPF